MAHNMGKTIFLNGKFVLEEGAKISALPGGYLYGWGIFETMRSYNNKIVYLEQHLSRIKKSCKLINMRFPYNINKLKEVIKRTVKINGFSDAYVRLTLRKSKAGTEASVITKVYQPPPSKKYKDGFRACISMLKQNEGSLLSRIKTENRLLYQLSYLKAREKGFDESIILNSRGYITEASRSNLFFIKKDEIFTPNLECGCLEGVTRKVIFDFAKKYGIPLEEGNFTLSNLYDATEAFLTNSLMGIMPLASIEKSRIGKGRNKLTRFFMERYKYLLRGENKNEKIYPNQ